MAAEKITRERLYKLVWEKPLRTLAQKYNISERELRKVCYRMNVPVPGSGYWSKLKFGKTVEREYLPFQEENIFIELFLREDPLGKEYFETEKTRLRNEKLKNKMVKPAENFPKLDPWVVNTKVFYEKYAGASRAIREEYTKTHPVLNLAVSDKVLTRALSFMNVFIQALKERDCRIETGNYGKTYVVCKGEKTEVYLREKNTQSYQRDEKYNWRTRVLTPNGKLCLAIGSYCRKEWCDTDQVKIETKIANIVAGIERETDRILQWQYECDRRRKKEEEEREREIAFRQQQDQELEKFKELFFAAEFHEKAQHIRGYLNTYEGELLRRDALTSEEEEWLEWGRRKADWLDPFADIRDELLDGLDKNTLIFNSRGK